VEQKAALSEGAALEQFAAKIQVLKKNKHTAPIPFIIFFNPYKNTNKINVSENKTS
jgi:hypothetical protein